MTLHITAFSALWFLPFVAPICLWAAWSDLRSMRIPNKAVLALVGVFLAIGLITLPFSEYAWRILQLAVVLLPGIFLNMTGLVGAGDIKFTAAAAPFIALGDISLVLLILAANSLAALITHRIAKHTPLRKLAPDWESWTREGKFPMGFSLGSTLVIYLGLGVAFGQ